MDITELICKDSVMTRYYKVNWNNLAPRDYRINMDVSIIIKVIDDGSVWMYNERLSNDWILLEPEIKNCATYNWVPISEEEVILERI